MKTKNLYQTEIAALALILMLAACNDLTGPEAKGASGEPIPVGMGMARIRLNAGEGARTAVPGIGTYYFTLEFIAPGKTTVNEALSGGMSITVALEPAVWTLEVKGYADSAKTDLKLSGRTSIPIVEGTASSFEVYLTPEFSFGGIGNLSYSISFPATTRGAFALYPMDDTPGTSLEIDISGAGGTASGALADLPEGSYRAAINLYDAAANKAAAWTGAAHISGGSTTILTHTFSTSDFAECGSLVATGENTLAAKLDAALGSSSGTYTIVLNGTETDLAAFAPKSLNVTGGKNIAITIRGNGNEVQLGSDGSLFTLEAVSGSSLTLALQDVTLRGRSDNDTSLVQVESGGTLEMKAGSLITEHTAYSGGGVYVDGGTFTMSGGAVSGNSGYWSGGVGVIDGTFSMSGGTISDNTGGGVYVRNGTFAMSGGAVSDNTGSGVYIWGYGAFNLSGGAVSGNNTSGSGGGVYVDGPGTFNLSGGAVSGNSALDDGGGVYVYLGGTFTMSGGAVSGNNTSQRGGGVCVEHGTFTMSDGAVSGNTASDCSGGVDVSSSGATFTMSGGTVSGNSSSYNGGGISVWSDSTFNLNGGSVSGNSALGSGGGVSVWGGTFSMSGGAVSGNNTSGSGGGVYVIGGTFSMSGGSVNDNTGSGGGVFVWTGTFSMSGGSVSGNSSSYNGGGVSVWSNGTFSMNEGVVSGNNTSGSGGGVYVQSGGIFTKQQGAIIYGLNENDNALRNTAGSVGSVYVSSSPEKIRYTTAGTDIILDSAVSGSAGGWESEPPPPLPSKGISNITYSFVSGGTWALEADGRRRSPSIGHSSVTKMRVNFTSTELNANITVQLDVSSESSYDFAFISTLDNASATSISGYYNGSRISGTVSATAIIPVPTPGGHFIDIGYQKDGSQTDGSDCAWFKIAE
jgi:hypothetical protein